MQTASTAQPIADRSIIVTGAASGFGKLVCEKSAALGARVLCADINEDGAKETAASINTAGGTADAIAVDVRDLATTQAMAAKAQALWGDIDVLINNAGIMPLAFYADHAQAADSWSRCIDINIKGVMNGIISVHDQMLAQGRGHVVNLSSIYGNHPVAGAAVYGATKAAVNFLSEALRVESQGRIKVTTIKPTGVPGTALGSGIVNPEAIVGILGQNAPGYMQQMQAHMAGELPPENSDPQHIEYYALEPEYLADQIIYAINQPWGVSISDITVRAAGDAYII